MGVTAIGWEMVEMLNPSANKANKGHFLYGPLSFLRKPNWRRKKEFLLGGIIVVTLMMLGNTIEKYKKHAL